MQRAVAFGFGDVLASAISFQEALNSFGDMAKGALFQK